LRAEEELGQQQHHDGHGAEEEHPSLAARLILWIVVFGQIYLPFRT
jgi:hypothetical protein